MVMKMVMNILMLLVPQPTVIIVKERHPGDGLSIDPNMANMCNLSGMRMKENVDTAPFRSRSRASSLPSTTTEIRVAGTVWLSTLARASMR